MQRKTQRVLGYAFVLSIVIHLLVLPYVRGESPTISDDPIHRIVLEKPVPIPTPKPSPRPTPRPTPNPHVIVHPNAHPPRIRIVIPNRTTHNGPGPSRPYIAGNGDRGNGGNVNGDASPGPATSAPAATPAPEPTRPLCPAPNVAATTLQAAVPETPPLAAQQGITGEVSVIVSLDERSRIVGARIARSPSSILNPAALRAVHDSTFRTEVRDCKAIAADYVFVIEFQQQ
jgi:outer membrane biosynthesis protein TonB